MSETETGTENPVEDNRIIQERKAKAQRLADEGLNLVLPGWPFTATTSIIRAIATATGEIRLGGYVHRATAT